MAEDGPDVDRVREQIKERDQRDEPPAGEEADRRRLDDPVREELRRWVTRGDG